MNYTLTQAIERTKDLSGEIKAARAHEADCAADHEAKLRIATIAAEAHNKAIGHCIALETEREELADHIAALVRKTGEPLEPTIAPLWASEGTSGGFFLAAEGETALANLHDKLLANGEARLNQAFDEATK